MAEPPYSYAAYGGRTEAEREWWLHTLYQQQVRARVGYYYGKSSWESCLFVSIIFGAIFIFLLGLIIVASTNQTHNHGNGDDHSWWEEDTSGMTALSEQMRTSMPRMFVYRPYDNEHQGKSFVRHYPDLTLPEAVARNVEGQIQYKLPTPREVSNRVCNRSVYTQPPPSDLDFFRPSSARLSNLVWVWGQFVQQCIVSTEGDPSAKLTLNFTGDVHFDPRKAGYLVDLEGVKSAGDDQFGRNILTNTLSPLLDASCIYGSNRETASTLRSFEKGRLRMFRSMSDEFILPMDSRNRLFIAGDPRVNENSPLTAIYTLWVREHNSIVDSLSEMFPDWQDEQLYWLARRIVTAEIQAITYHEWLPTLFGGEDKVPLLEPGSASYGDIALSLTFSAVAFRAAHSMVPDTLPLVSPGIGGLVDIVPLHSMFMNPELIRKGGIDAVLAGLVASPMEEVDVVYAESLRNALFVGGPSRELKLDLASLDIARGREADIGSYGQLREALGLRAPKKWEEITSDPVVRTQLIALYPDGPASVDPLIGMLAEDHLPVDGGDSEDEDCLSPLPPTIAAVWKQEFADLRNGDPFYYEVDPGMADMKDTITQTRLHHIILRNTNIAEHVLLGKAAATLVLPPAELLKKKHKEAKEVQKKKNNHHHKKRKHHKRWKHKHAKDDFEKQINEGEKTDTNLFFTNGRLDDLYYPPV